MKLPVALALVIGIVGGILTYLYVGPLSALGLFIPATSSVWRATPRPAVTWRR